MGGGGKEGRDAEGDCGEADSVRAMRGAVDD